MAKFEVGHKFRFNQLFLDSVKHISWKISSALMQNELKPKP